MLKSGLLICPRFLANHKDQDGEGKNVFAIQKLVEIRDKNRHKKGNIPENKIHVLLHFMIFCRTASSVKLKWVQ